MNANTLSGLVEVIRSLDIKRETLVEIFGSESISFLDNEIERLEEIILKELGVPEDNTLDMLEKYGDPEAYFQEETFCRDYISNWFFDYYKGKMEKEKLIFNLFNWEKLGVMLDRETT